MSILSLSNVKKTWYYLQKNGIHAAYLAALERLKEHKQPPYTYEAPDEKTLEAQRSAAQAMDGITFSVVVPAYETKTEHLEALLDSLEAQTYPKWELILADASKSDTVKDTLARWKKGHTGHAIRYLKLEKNGGIAENTNAGIAAASGEYIGLLDHDDLLTPDAFYEMASAIEKESKEGRRPKVLYSDEDKCDKTGTIFYEPHRKMEFNLDLLLSNNYICHFLVMESGLIKKLRLRPAFDGAQDYDLVLRAAMEQGAVKRQGGREEPACFTHVPRVLYHWRCHSDSTAVNPRSKSYAYEAGKRAVEDFYQNAGWKVSVSHLKHLGFYRADYGEDLFGTRPDLGALAGPLWDKKNLQSGIYETDGRMRYEGLKKGFSGPMHRAALQQDVEAADIRSMRVCDALLLPYQESMERAAAGTEEDYMRESRAFCRKVRSAGYRILWDPQASIQEK